jgi:hypothetical protein
MVVEYVCFANKAICLQLHLKMGPLNQNSNKQKAWKNNRNICFIRASNLIKAANITFETAIRYHGNTAAKFIALLQRSKLPTPLYTVLQKKHDYYRKM